MSLSSFKIAHKLLTGSAAIEQLSTELSRLDIDNPLIVTDAALVKSGTVELALAQLGGGITRFSTGCYPTRKSPSSKIACRFIARAGTTG